MAWLRTVSPEEATGPLARIYAEAIERAGRVFQIVRMMSLAPRVLEASMTLYKRIMLSRGHLSREQRELLAVVVSRVNDCHY